MYCKQIIELKKNAIFPWDHTIFHKLACVKALKINLMTL
jgi:hypothetical protein